LAFLTPIFGLFEAIWTPKGAFSGQIPLRYKTSRQDALVRCLNLFRSKSPIGVGVPPIHYFVWLGVYLANIFVILAIFIVFIVNLL
jgi:hypothetical protein